MHMLSCAVLVCLIAHERVWQIGQTETVQDNPNADFATPISVAYYFEELQTLKFDV
jgi:hypothetical protein